VDGKEIPKQELNKTNSSNIETISVLKDESAIKKYGDKGKNGVIEITTKKNIVNVAPPDSTYYDGNSEKNILTLKLKDRSDTLPKAKDADKVFTKVEVEASFPGGDMAWTRYIKKVIETNIKEIANDNKSGTCRIRFIVDVDGSVRDVKVLSMQGTKLAEISENAIRKGPKWVPAKQKDQVVAAYREQPITFTIQEVK
jgi:TonB-dependent SusC/RagA subfamily outer membrane receptor